MDAASQGVQFDRHVFLVGRPPLEEYLGFVSSMAREGTADLGTLVTEWRLANDHIRELEVQERGIADNPPVGELPAQLRPQVEELLADPVFRKSFAVAPTKLALVELDRLVVFQKQINLNFVEALKGQLGTAPDEETVFSFCLPSHPQLPPVKWLRIAQNAYVFVSPSTDFRFLEPVILEPSAVPGYHATGRVIALVGLVLGFGSNYLNALQVGNRLVLNNGSHRAYALRDMGITHAPCAIQQTSRREELGVIANREMVDHPERYLEVPRPPMLRDYFDARLRKIIEVPRKVRQVKISFGVEQTDLPT